MVMLMFSIRDHISRIYDGTKIHTTRTRQTRIRTGDKIHMYFIPRMKKGNCFNCVVDCDNAGTKQRGCEKWTNYIGTSIATVLSVDVLDWSSAGLEKWARNDGFDGFKTANRWFTEHYGPGWKEQKWDIMFFTAPWPASSRGK